LYRLSIHPNDLAWLYENYWTYETVPAIFIYQDQVYEVDVRFRGGTARQLPKKSWKIDFPAATPFQGQRELNLNAEYTDKSLLRERLAYDLFERAGLTASRTQFVRLEINGHYKGLFLQVEQVDQRFLDRVGWSSSSNLYKGDYGNFELSHDYAAYVDSYAKKTNRQDSHADVIAFVEMINHTPQADFPTTLTALMDVGEYLDWVAVQVVLGNFEWLEKNYYLYHHLGEGWWTFIPWDMDLLLGHNWHWGPDGTLDTDVTWDNPIDSGTQGSKKVDGKWNKLVTKVLRVDDFRFAYCRRLWELMNDEFAQAVMFERIDNFYRTIIPYAEADPYKWGNNQDFHYGPTELKTYVTQRLNWLTAQFPAYCPQTGSIRWPMLNELMVDNTSTVADEAGEYEPWIEMYNPALVSFDVGGMGLRPVFSGTLVPQWTLPEDTVIPSKGFLLIWADGEPEQGPLHASFKLNRDGGSVVLLDKAVHGGQVIAQQDYHPVGADLSFGRIRDGDATWITFAPPTPGESNLGRAPLVTATAHLPLEPAEGEAVTVTSIVSQTGVYSAGLDVSLHWFAGGVAQVSLMVEDGGHTDGAVGDRRYAAVLPPLASGTVVTFYVRAENPSGLIGTDPPQPSFTLPGFPAPAFAYVVGFERPPLYINELMAVNRDALEDEAGESDDWFEVYNAGSTEIDMSGMYLTDAIENATKWQIPPGVTVPPSGHALFWADSQPEQGIQHVNFKLDGDGERLALYAGPAGYGGLIDEVYYGPQTVDQSWGRYRDGQATWRRLLPTPGQANRQSPPLISDLVQSPAQPLPGRAVTIIVTVHDDDPVLSATLHYSVGAGFESLLMQPGIGHQFGARIPPQPEGQRVDYYVSAQDGLGAVTTCPSDAPGTTYGYRVGGVSPPLWINEFLASNDSINTDERGEYEDWVELYNAGAEPLDVGGMYLTDDLSQPTKWRIPQGTLIPPGGFLLIWTDDDEGDGPLHTGFKLSKDGEEIGLFDRDANANALIDRVIFGAQITDISTGRSPDGGANWVTFISPTPGTCNAP